MIPGAAKDRLRKRAPKRVVRGRHAGCRSGDRGGEIGGLVDHQLRPPGVDQLAEWLETARCLDLPKPAGEADHPPLEEREMRQLLPMRRKLRLQLDQGRAKWRMPEPGTLDAIVLIRRSCNGDVVAPSGKGGGEREHRQQMAVATGRGEEDAQRRPYSGVRNAASLAFSSGDIGSLTATRT